MVVVVVVVVVMVVLCFGWGRLVSYAAGDVDELANRLLFVSSVSPKGIVEGELKGVLSRNRQRGTEVLGAQSHNN